MSATMQLKDIQKVLQSKFKRKSLCQSKAGWFRLFMTVSQASQARTEGVCQGNSPLGGLWAHFCCRESYRHSPNTLRAVAAPCY